MENWKDIIARRIREREERRLGVERLFYKIESTLTKLLKDLSKEYNIKANYRSKYTKDNEPYWTISIEDESVELNANSLYKYLNENQDLEDAIIQLILNNFQFKT